MATVRNGLCLNQFSPAGSNARKLLFLLEIDGNGRGSSKDKYKAQNDADNQLVACYVGYMMTTRMWVSHGSGHMHSPFRKII